MSKMTSVNVALDAIVLRIDDYSSPTTTIVNEPTRVIVKGATKPTVNVYLGGIRGVVYPPGVPGPKGDKGDPGDGSGIGTTAEVLSLLDHAVDFQHLSTDVNAMLSRLDVDLNKTIVDLDIAEIKIDTLFSYISGVEGDINDIQADISLHNQRINNAENTITNNYITLSDAILLQSETINTLTDDLYTTKIKLDQEILLQATHYEALTGNISTTSITLNDAITLQATRIDNVENSINEAMVIVDANEIRLSVTETDINTYGNYITAQQSMLANQWNVKIEEYAAGQYCVAGVGLIVNRYWEEDELYDEDENVYHLGEVYRAKLPHTASTTNAPPNVTYWELIPNGAKSEFGVYADKFFIQTSTGNRIMPFVVTEDEVTINTTLVIRGLDDTGVSTAIDNFNASNDRNATAIVNPTIVSNGNAVDHSINTDGSCDISFEWLWSGNEADIDGFIIYIYASTSSSAYSFGSAPASEQGFYIPASKRAFIYYGAAANQYYTFGVQAYRRVDTDINVNGIIKSNLVKPSLASENPYRPSSSVAFAGNVTGTIDGVSAATVQSNAAAAMAAVIAIESDGVFSIAEKRAWQTDWPGMEAYYESIRLAAVAEGVNTADMVAARLALYNFLNTTHQVWAATLTSTNFTPLTFTNLLSTYYTELNDAAVATAQAKADGAESTSKTYADNINFASKINAGTTTISGDKIYTGTIQATSIKTAASGKRIEISASENTLKAYNSSGTLIAGFGDSNGAGSGAVAAFGTTGYGLWGESSGNHGIWGRSTATGDGNGVVGTTTNTNNAGTGGSNTASGSAGLLGYRQWDVYAFGNANDANNYGPFTGAHDVLLRRGIAPPPKGSLVCDVECVYVKGISNTIFEVAPSQTISDRPVGVISSIPERLTILNPPAALAQGLDENFVPVVIDELWDIAQIYDLCSINAVGEGQILVCGENGNMINGDLICCSSQPGIGMKQHDDIIRSITAAKVRGNVTFSDPTEVKLVPCIYLCG